MTDLNGDAPLLSELEFNEKARIAEVFYAAIISRNPTMACAFDVAFGHAELFFAARERARRAHVR